MKKSSSTLPYPTLPCLRILSVESLSKSLILTFCFTLGSTFTSAQICRLEKSCRDISGPVFLDSPTLCESVTGFDPDYTIRNNAHASYLPYSIWDSTTAFNNVDIYIEGLFYIDEPIYFKDCRIKMASGAQIIVTSQAFKDDLMAFRSKFFSCDSMWKGIVLEEGTRCRLFKCTIEDAQYALTVDEYVSLALYGNTFNRNFVSIVNADGNTTLPFLLFKNNTFDCTSALSDYYDLDFTCCFEDPVSFAGILLNDCSASIGYFGSMNRFKSMNYGIFANASTINVKGCEFYNAQEGTIIPDLVQDYPIPGCGIAAYNSVVYIVGDEGVVSSKFDNADVIVNGSSLELKYGLFLESNVVADENLTGETVDIEYCKFQGDDDPSTISVKRSMASGEDFHTIINYDTITNLYPERFPLAAIHLNGVQDPTDFADVSGNVIKSAGIPYSAIRFTVGYSENNLINNNYIQWTNTDDRIIGIRAFLGRTYGSIISSDTIIGGSTIDVIHDSYGISSELVSMDMRYCANYIKNVGYCHAIRGACGGLNNISLNEYDYSGVGLDIGLYDSIPGVSGIQTGTRNKWLMDSTGYLLNTARNTNTNLDINGYYISREPLKTHLIFM